MACATCGDLLDSSQSNSDSTPTLPPPELRKLRELGTCFDSTELLLCPACGALFSHAHDRDQETGITDDSVRRLEGPRAVTLLVYGLSWPSIEPKSEMLSALAARIGRVAPSTPLEDLELCRAELMGASANELLPELKKHVDTELGARALAAAGAFTFLQEEALRGSRPAIRALGRSGPAEIAPTLVQVLLNSSDGMARREAAQGLGRLGAGRNELYVVMTTVKDSNVTQPARDALARMGATELLLEGLNSADWSMRWMAAEGLGSAGKSTPEIISALERAVLTPGGPPISRTTAFDSLRRLGATSERLELVVGPGIDHADEDLRRSSRLCLEQLER